MDSDTGLRVMTKAVVIVITSLLGGIKGILSFPPSAINKQSTIIHHRYP